MSDFLQMQTEHSFRLDGRCAYCGTSMFAPTLDSRCIPVEPDIVEDRAMGDSGFVKAQHSMIRQPPDPRKPYATAKNEPNANGHSNMASPYPATSGRRNAASAGTSSRSPSATSKASASAATRPKSRSKQRMNPTDVIRCANVATEAILSRPRIGR